MLTCIFACTSLKTLKPPRRLQARSYRADEPAEAYSHWEAALTEATETTSVATLYKGGYWASSHRLIQETSLPTQALVASAGIGLREFNEQVPGYAATFNRQDLDTVPGGESLEGQRAWWSRIGGEQKLRALADLHTPQIAVALPVGYLRVVMPDLEYLRDKLGPRALAVFTSDNYAVKRLGDSAVPLKGQMSKVLGGPVGQITVRALEYVVQTARHPEDVNASEARSLLEAVLRQSPRGMYPKRRKQNAQDVATWITEALTTNDPPTSATAALSRFRSQGLGFEQKHFARIYHEVQEGNS